MKVIDCPLCGEEITATATDTAGSEIAVEIRSACGHIPERDVVVKATAEGGRKF
jgi:hypothetical protein